MEFSAYTLDFELIFRYKTINNRDIEPHLGTPLAQSSLAPYCTLTPEFILLLFKQFTKEIKFKYIEIDHKEYILNLIDANEVTLYHYHNPHVVIFIKVFHRFNFRCPIELRILVDKTYLNSKYCILIALVSYIRTTGFTNTTQFKSLNKFLMNEKIYRCA
jgi:hypothetical protein